MANEIDYIAARCWYVCCFPSCTLQKSEHKIPGWCKGQKRKTLHEWLPFGPCVSFHPFNFEAISTMRFKLPLLTWYVPSTSHVGGQHKGGFLYYTAIGELEDVLLNCYRQKQALSRTVAGPSYGKQVKKSGSCFLSSTQCCARGFMRKKKHMLQLVHRLLHCQSETVSSSLHAVCACRNMWKTESITCSYICSPFII